MRRLFVIYSRMKIMNQGALALALSLGLFAAHGAQAQLLDASTGIRLETGTGMGTGTGAMPILSATTSVGAGAGHTTATTTSDTASAGGSLGFSFARNDLAGAEYSVTDATDVHTPAALEAYAGASMKDDNRLTSVSLDAGNLTVTYKTDAKFLGFIPASVTVTATVDADGAVTVKYPWYAFLMSTYENRTELEARLTKEQGAIRGEVMEPVASVGGEASLEARQWALMLERLRSSLYVTASADARR